MSPAHPLVAAWQPLDAAPGSACVVPSEAGARHYRKQGWRGLQQALADWATAQGLDARALRFASALPEPGEPLAAPHEPRLLASAPAANGGVALTLLVPFELAVFHGHFPTVPIVPGAQLAGWAALLGARHAGWMHGLRACAPVKFRRPVQPGHELLLALRANEAATRLDFRYERAGVLHAQGALLAA